jgi:hypothetical protein
VPVAIYKHHKLTGPDQYRYDMQFQGTGEWSDGLAMFAADATEAAGTVPIYEYRAADGRYYYDSLDHNDWGWVRGAVAFYAYKTQIKGTVPIYQHVAAGGRYAYDTLNHNEYGWTQGTVVWYANPTTITLSDEIMYVLGTDPVRYRGVTYGDYRNNAFTLLDTPGLWDKGPSSAYDLLSHRNAGGPFPIPACNELLSQISFLIGSGRAFVDITLLWDPRPGTPTMPSGDFQQALSSGIWGFDGSYNDPNKVIRILVGLPTPSIALDRDLEDWLRATVEMNGHKVSDLKCSIYLARAHDGLNSFNHAKIIAVDGDRAIVGGHNLWPSAYLGPSPVHDVSGLFQGEAAAGAHQFCNRLWTQTLGDTTVLRKGTITSVSRDAGRPPNFTPRTDIDHHYGTARMLGIGRLGGMASTTSIGSNAGVSARLMALCRAKYAIRMSQMSLDFDFGDFDFYTCLALVKAMRAGVHVYLVASNEDTDGYEGHVRKTVQRLAYLYVCERLGIFKTRFENPARDDLAAWLAASLDPPGNITCTRIPTKDEINTSLIELNERMSVARLYFSPGVDYWLAGGKNKIMAGNHAKVFIIDDTHFYVGSDNCYESGSVHGLQEYGYLIEDQSATAEFMTTYWDKLWKNSVLGWVQPESPWS